VKNFYGALFYRGAFCEKIVLDFIEINILKRLKRRNNPMSYLKTLAKILSTFLV